MIYDTIDTTKLHLGTPQEFVPGKLITPIFYEDEEFEFSLKNKYHRIHGVRTSAYDKDYIIIKSAMLTDQINAVAEVLKVDSPVFGDATVRINLNANADIRNTDTSNSMSIKDLEGKTVHASVSIIFPTIYKDKSSGKTSLQLVVGTMLVHKILRGALEVDLDKLVLAD